MATNTYVALDKVTVGTATASVSFNSISSAYTDLVIVASGTATSGAPSTLIRFNGDTTSNYSYTYLTGDGTSATSGRASTQTSIVASYNGAPFSSPNTNIIQVMNYANATTFKTVICRAGQTSYGTDAIVGLWRKTPEAITSITLTTSSSTYAAGSTFSLYGIKSEEAAAKATGGYVTSDANYFYHTFLASGTFTPTQSLTTDILVVAGGGAAGGGGGSGGGGAGGLVYLSSQAVTATNYTVTVGAGGAYTTSAKVSGSNSQFGGLTAAVGGGGGGYDIASGDDNGLSGGSGGGGSIDTTAAASGTSGQGSAGGLGKRGSNNILSGGGGGGAGAVGADAGSSLNTPGNGGNGVSTYSTFGSVTGTGENISGTYWYAGGGGGGGWTATGTATGGSGGGGGYLRNNGLSNTGGGGGAASGGTPVTTPNGGSGIVIVRYAK